MKHIETIILLRGLVNIKSYDSFKFHYSIQKNIQLLKESGKPLEDLETALPDKEKELEKYNEEMFKYQEFIKTEDSSYQPYMIKFGDIPFNLSKEDTETIYPLILKED